MNKYGELKWETNIKLVHKNVLQKVNVMERQLLEHGVQYMIRHSEFSLIMASDLLPISDTISTKVSVLIL